jgi:NADPH2:quinone reductase
MRAVVCREYGSYRDMQVEDMRPPEMISGGVRIAVKAAGISFANLLVVEGKHQNTPALPFVPGTEIAGVVLEVAAGIEHVRPGDRVAAGVRNAGFAEEVVVPADNVWPIPAAMDFPTATHFPTIYATAYGCLAWRAQMQPGEWLLVHAAAGASGLAAVELGKALGAVVIATAGSPDKLAVAHDHGADHVIDYRQDDFRTAVLDLTGGRGADVIFDPVGGDTFDQSMRCIAPGGRIIPMGFAGGRIPNIPANLLLVKNVTAIGLYWGHYMGWGRQPRTDADIRNLHATMARMFRWYEDGKLKPVNYAVLPMEQFADGMDMVAGRSAIGKVILSLE